MDEFSRVTIEMYEDSAEEYRWRMTVDGDIVARSSEGYINKTDCRRSAHLFRMAGHRLSDMSAQRFTVEGFEDRGGELYWRMDAGNGETIAVSPENYQYPEERNAMNEDLRRAYLGGFYATRIRDTTDE